MVIYSVGEPVLMLSVDLNKKIYYSIEPDNLVITAGKMSKQFGDTREEWDVVSVSGSLETDTTNRKTFGQIIVMEDDSTI